MNGAVDTVDFELSEMSLDDEEVDIMYHSLVPGSLASFGLQQKQACFFLGMTLFFYQPMINLFIVHSAQEESGEGP